MHGRGGAVSRSVCVWGGLFGRHCERRCNSGGCSSCWRRAGHLAAAQMLQRLLLRAFTPLPCLLPVAVGLGCATVAFRFTRAAVGHGSHTNVGQKEGIHIFVAVWVCCALATGPASHIKRYYPGHHLGVPCCSLLCALLHAVQGFSPLRAALRSSLANNATQRNHYQNDYVLR